MSTVIRWLFIAFFFLVALIGLYAVCMRVWPECRHAPMRFWNAALYLTAFLASTIAASLWECKRDHLRELGTAILFFGCAPCVTIVLASDLPLVRYIGGAGVAVVTGTMFIMGVRQRSLSFGAYLALNFAAFAVTVYYATVGMAPSILSAILAVALGLAAIGLVHALMFRFVPLADVSSS